ncbi:MAG: hypothetical protein ABI539_10275 [Acidobacteriota bacterium]
MSNKTIAKICLFVIFVGIATAAAACKRILSGPDDRPDFDTADSPYGTPEKVGVIESKDIKESSGLAASRCNTGVLWTHNDSGDGAFIYALSTSGRTLGTWEVTGAENNDWEDIATVKDKDGKCWLYIGEIGNNEGKRDRTLVYRVAEPAVTPDAKDSSRKSPLATSPARSVAIIYPDGAPNAETLMINPVTGKIYIVTKRMDGPATVYSADADFASGSDAAARKVAELSVPSVPNGLFTGGDISPDGTRAALCDYVAGYELVLPAGSSDFDNIWSQKPTKFDIGDRKNGEAIAYSTDGRTLFSDSEGKDAPIFEMKRSD